jgi:hypothetical protein
MLHACLVPSQSSMPDLDGPTYFSRLPHLPGIN